MPETNRIFLFRTPPGSIHAATAEHRGHSGPNASSIDASHLVPHGSALTFDHAAVITLERTRRLGRQPIDDVAHAGHAFGHRDLTALAGFRCHLSGI